MYFFRLSKFIISDKNEECSAFANLYPIPLFFGKHFLKCLHNFFLIVLSLSQ